MTALATNYQQPNPLFGVEDAGVEGVFDGLGHGEGDAGELGDGVDVGGGKAANRAKGFEELFFAVGADAREFVQDGGFHGAEAQGTVEGDGKAVGFVAEAHEDLEGFGVAREDEVGAAFAEDDLFKVFV